MAAHEYRRSGLLGNENRSPKAQFRNGSTCLIGRKYPRKLDAAYGNISG